MATVYADIVFLINFVISLLILMVAKKLLHLKSGKLRMILGGIYCSLYTMLMLFPSFRLCFTVFGRIVFSLTLMPIVFRITGIKPLIRAVLTFYIVTFAFGGAVYGVSQLLRQRSPMPVIVLLLSSAAAYFLILFVNRRRQAALSGAKQITEVTVCICGSEVTFPCLVDTGNSLCSPIMQRPVTIAERSVIEGIIPADLHRVALSYIPYKSVGTESGVLPAIKSDWLLTGSHKESNAIIGIYSGRLSSDGSYNGLMNPVLLEEAQGNENLCSEPEKPLQQIYE